MLSGETNAVCSKIHTKHANKAELYQRLSPYRAVNTPRQGFFKIKQLMLYGEKNAGCSVIHIKHVTKAESYYRLRSYRAENSSLYVRLLTSSSGLGNSNVLIALLPSGSAPWNSKRRIVTRFTEFYMRYETQKIRRQNSVSLVLNMVVNIIATRL
jgi:hypothetical protein